MAKPIDRTQGENKVPALGDRSNKTKPYAGPPGYRRQEHKGHADGAPDQTRIETKK